MTISRRSLSHSLVGPEANYTNVGEEPTYATIDDARQLQPFLVESNIRQHQKYSIEPNSTRQLADHHLSSDSLDQWQESYLDTNTTNNNSNQQPYSGFAHQNGWSANNNTNNQTFSGSQYMSEVEEYSSVLRTSSYALLNLGPKSITGGGNAGKQPGHFHSLPYIGAQVKKDSDKVKENDDTMGGTERQGVRRMPKMMISNGRLVANQGWLPVSDQARLPLDPPIH